MNNTPTITTTEEASEALDFIADYLSDLAEGATSRFAHRRAVGYGFQLADIYGMRLGGATTTNLTALVLAVAPIIAEDLAYDAHQDWA